MLSNLRYGFRQFRKAPGFFLIAILTLALCIGANTAIFSMINSLLLKPLPFPNPNRIVWIFNNFPKIHLDHWPSNIVQYTDFKNNTAAFDAIGLWNDAAATVGDESSAERIEVAICTAEMFDVLGIKPILGEFFTLQNSRIGEDKVIVLTESFWKSQFNEDPAVLGREIRVNGRPYHIIGVAPQTLEAFDANAKLLVPQTWKPDSIGPSTRYGLNLPLYARLKAETPLIGALTQISGLEQRFYDTASPTVKGILDRSGHKIAMEVVQVERIKPIKSSLYLLQAGVVLVLLIGCVNVANLLLARANGRQSELAVRAALGASRGAIARQLLIESVALTLAGALLGVGIAYAAVHEINHFTAKLLPNQRPIAIDGSVLFYTAAVSITLGLLIGVLPVFHTLRSNLVEVMQRSSRSASGGRGVRALNGLLVTGQVAVTLILLSGTGLLIHSFANVLAVNPGFDPQNLVVGRVALPSAYQDSNRATALQWRLDAALKEIPGVEDVALATEIPFRAGSKINALTLKEGTLPRDAAQPGAYQIGTSLDYFRTLHIPLLEGRYFQNSDTLRPGHAYLVDQHFAQLYFPGRSAVGAHFTFGAEPKNDADWPVVVGVVRNVRQNGVEGDNDNPCVYYPLLTSTPFELNLFLRSSWPTGDLIPAMRNKLKTLDPSIPLFGTGTVQQTIDDSFDNRRALMLLLGSFAALALFLSALGIYGVLAYDISQRTHEIGIRGAVGATRAQIVGMVMRQGLARAGIGLAVGLTAAVILSRYMAGMLYELKATDPWSYMVVSVILTAVAIAASYVPARRAANVDPVVALRVE